jgi:hypothetical protein
VHVRYLGLNGFMVGGGGGIHWALILAVITTAEGLGACLAPDIAKGLLGTLVKVFNNLVITDAQNHNRHYIKQGTPVLDQSFDFGPGFMQLLAVIFICGRGCHSYLYKVCGQRPILL